MIANGNLDDVLLMIGRGSDVGTVLAADVEPLASRKRWIAGQLIAKGEIALDAGAVEAVRNRGVSVLAVGAVRATGAFRRGDMVRVTDVAGAEVAKGLVNYSGDEIRLLLGAASSEIESRLGYVDEPELIHRDNLAGTLMLPGVGSESPRTRKETRAIPAVAGYVLPRCEIRVQPSAWIWACSRDLCRAALFLCRMPLRTSLSRTGTAVSNAAAAASLSPAASAVLTRFR